MRVPAKYLIAATALVAAGALIAACSDSPASPSQVVTTVPPPPAPPAEPTLSSLRIEGPGVVPLGETVEFKLVARLTNGTELDMTKDAEWSGGWGDFVSIPQPGQIQGRSRGQTAIEVTLDQRHVASKFVLVLPAGTYLLQGQVNEAGTAGPVAGAFVQVRSGAGTGLTATTDSSGTYWLFGVAGPTTIRVTKSGYHPVEQTVSVDAHDYLNLKLPLVTERADVSGVYELRVTAAPECATSLPEQARTRRYKATIEQTGPSLRVSLSDAKLRPYFDRFEGRVEPDRVVFDLVWYDGEGPRVIEDVPALGLVVLDGLAIVSASRDQLAGTLNGAVKVFNSDSYRGAPSAWCPSGGHQFVLTR